MLKLRGYVGAKSPVSRFEVLPILADGMIEGIRAFVGDLCAIR